MTIRLLNPFVRDYKKLDPPVRLKVDEFLTVLAKDFRHSSLRVRKMVNQKDIYEARIDGQFRATFEMNGNILTMRRVGGHEIYRNP